MPARHSTSARSGLNRIQRDLDQLFKRAEDVDQSSDLQSDLARYICVRLSGYLEQSLVLCGQSLCNQKAFGEGLDFSLSFLEKAPNPRRDVIEAFVGRFSSQWSKDLQELMATDEIGNSINSLVGIRNDIAHGKSQGVSLRRAYDYYAVVQRVIDFLVLRFEPLPKPNTTNDSF